MASSISVNETWGSIRTKLNVFIAEWAAFLADPELTGPTITGATISGTIAGNPNFSGTALGFGIASGVVFEIGRVDGQASASYFDFHTGATAVDFDFRIAASGGNGSNGGGTLTFTGGSLVLNSPVSCALPPKMPTYTVATLPNAATYTGGMIFVSDESGGAVMAFSDGTNWRRVTDRAIVS